MLSQKRPTKKQQALLNFVQDFVEVHNYSPSYREIMHALNLNSVSAVAEHIENCVKAGYLRKTPNSARSLEVIPLKTHDETIQLFRDKLYALELADPLDPRIKTLQDAADILELNLD